MRKGNVVKFFVVGLIFSALSILSAVAVAEEAEQASTVKAVSLQNFEPKNGAEDEYFIDIWKSESDFATDIVHSGSRSLMTETGDEWGGAIGIQPVSKDGYADLSKAKKVSIWVYDTIGNNTIQLRLKDVEGNGGSGNDNNFLWSTKSTKKDAWTQIKWSLNKYPKVEDLDLTKISVLEIYLPKAGVYYLDDLELVE